MIFFVFCQFPDETDRTQSAYGRDTRISTGATVSKRSGEVFDRSAAKIFLRPLAWSVQSKQKNKSDIDPFCKAMYCACIVVTIVSSGLIINIKNVVSKDKNCV